MTKGFTAQVTITEKDITLANDYITAVIQEYRATFYQANGRYPRVSTRGHIIMVDGETRYTVEKLRELTANLRWRITGDRQQCCA